MTGLSSIGEAAVLAPLTTSAFVSLHTADPGNTGGSEVSGGAYARQGPVTFANAGNNPPVASNSGIVSFPAATRILGHGCLFRRLDGGNEQGRFQGSGALTTSKAVGNGDTARFIAGALTITVQ